MLAIIVGLVSEARIAARLGHPVAIGGGTAEGATRAAQHLIDQGATALLSFGIAGGLDPALSPGTLINPVAILDGPTRYPTTPTLIPWAPPPAHILAGTDTPAATAREKATLHQTGAVAVDMESHAVARLATAHNLPFAALRAIADPATTTLPCAALIPLTDGRPNLPRILVSLATNPAQLPQLLHLARHAAAAHAALRKAITASNLS